MAEVRHQDPESLEWKPYGRRLYVWTVQVLGWAAETLKGIHPATGHPRDTVALVAALALTRAGCRRRETGALLVAAGLVSYSDDEVERMKELLRRARRNTMVVAAAERVLAASNGKSGQLACPTPR